MAMVRVCFRVFGKTHTHPLKVGISKLLKRVIPQLTKQKLREFLKQLLKREVHFSWETDGFGRWEALALKQT